MGCFTTATPSHKALDPYKRVRYSLGMVLGPDEFEQNLIYFMERDRLHQRALHGYGTVCGLKVEQRRDPDAPTVMVTPPEVLVWPGLAVDLEGQTIRVEEAQCARIDPWLQANEEAVLDRLGSPPGTAPLELYVVLCYAECETDATFVPGEPCRTQEETIVPSRIADGFELKLVFDPPHPGGEELVRSFADLLRRIRITEGATDYTTPAELEELVRALPETGGASLSSPVSPDEEGTWLNLHPLDAGEGGLSAILEDLYRLWVTEVRPQGGCDAGDPSGGGCVLLSRLAFDVSTSGALRVDGAITVDEEERPILLPTRLLQEWLGIGGEWAASQPAGVATEHGALSGLADDDHPHYLSVDPGTRALLNDLDAGGSRIVNLDAAAAAGEAVTFEQAVKNGDPAGGDLDGPYPAPVVSRLQRRPVEDVDPTDGDVLTWVSDADGERWTPRAAPSGDGAGMGEEELTRIVALSWVHGRPNALQIRHTDADGETEEIFGLAFAVGREEVDDDGRVQIATVNEQTFQLFIERPGESDLLMRMRVPHARTPRERTSRASIVPVKVEELFDGLIRATTTEESEDSASAFLMLLPEDLLEGLLNAEIEGLQVVIKGNFILDTSDKALDAEFVRATLPTGDRPRGAPRGIQGGVFESWLSTNRELVRPIDVNSASLRRLQRLPDVGEQRAQSIVDNREYEDMEDFVSRSGLPESVLRTIRGLITIES